LLHVLVHLLFSWSKKQGAGTVPLVGLWASVGFLFGWLLLVFGLGRAVPSFGFGAAREMPVGGKGRAAGLAGGSSGRFGKDGFKQVKGFDFVV
jgi:hypothetical protein